jgi:ubiquitin carboxyl-terminal hydrolase 8
VWLLERLQEDFNYSRARGPLLPLTTSQEAVRRRQPDIRSSWMQWQRYYHTNGSVITDNFYGQETHTITCPSCGFVEKSWQAWGQIPLPMNVPSNSSIGLDGLLDAMYAQPTVVEGYRCNNCKQEGSERSVKISRCPQILIIVLSRYEWTGVKAVRKNTRVSFPLSNLSLDSYFISDEGKGSERLDYGFTAPFNYDCYAVVRHKGQNPHEGHYTCLVKETARSGKDIWVEYDDQRVTEVENIHKTIYNKEAYMLFYRRLQNPPNRRNLPEVVEPVR